MRRSACSCARAGGKPGDLGAGGIFHSLLNPSTKYEFALGLH
jgi:hypothetical protein